jgi:ABC-type uncharacterized transport system fused permease/ATPase subunit
MTGRARELRAIDQLLARAACGSGGHLVVHGPSGAGKSALLEAATELPWRTPIGWWPRSAGPASWSADRERNGFAGSIS